MNKTDNENLTLKEVIAMGIGGMVGGGIFSVLGLAISRAGHAAPIAFAFGGPIALLTRLAYARLGLAFQSSGGENATQPPQTDKYTGTQKPGRRVFFTGVPYRRDCPAGCLQPVR